MGANDRAEGRVLRIVGPDFVAGIVLTVGESDGTETASQEAPKVRYMHGWTEERIRSYCIEHRWSVSSIDPFVA